MRTKPFIALPAQPLRPGRVSGWANWGAYAAPEGYVDALRRAGARPAFLTPDDAEPREVLEDFDGLLLMGGGDVEPSRYGQDTRPESYGIEPARDAFEIGLVHAARDVGLPVFAICRGIQVVNVALGGSLHQHLPAVPGMGEHGPPLGDAPVIHDVKLSPGSRITEAVDGERVGGASHHHQGIDRLGQGLVPTGWSDDGLVEAIEGEDGWLVGVQWHPEETAADDPAQQRLFDAFVARSRSG